MLTFTKVSYYQQKRHKKYLTKKFGLRDDYLVENLRYSILRKSEDVLRFGIFLWRKSFKFKNNFNTDLISYVNLS